MLCSIATVIQSASLLTALQMLQLVTYHRLIWQGCLAFWHGNRFLGAGVPQQAGVFVDRVSADLVNINQPKQCDSIVQ